MLAVNYENTAFLCIFCKNAENYQSFKRKAESQKKLAALQGKKIDAIRKSIAKDYLVDTKAFSATSPNYFMPQIEDQVMYFFQGHEQFYQSNNCFFYCGDQKEKGSTDLPWMRIPFLKNLPRGALLCQVKNLSHSFSSLKSVSLMNDFGDCSSDITQVPRIVTYLELEVIDPALLEGQQSAEVSKFKTFIAEVFPSEATQYIVPLEIYEAKKAAFEKLRAEGNLLGRRFKSHPSSQTLQSLEYRVQEVAALEPDTLGESDWKSVVVSEVKSLSNNRFDRGRTNDRSSTHGSERRVNFWDLIYEDSPQQQSLQAFARSCLPVAFDEMESSRLEDTIRLFNQKNEEFKQFFKERVTEGIADDYKCYVAAEMWLDLVVERIKGAYYRSQAQLWHDIDQIPHCSLIYNGENEELTQNAKQNTEKLKKELKNFVRRAKPPKKPAGPAADLGFEPAFPETSQ